MLVNKKLIREFFRQYGSQIRDLETQAIDYGVLAPVKRYGTDTDTVQQRQSGYEINSEHVLLTLNEMDLVKKGATVQMNGQKFRVINTDFYYYANKPLYLRAYLHKEIPRHQEAAT